MTKVVIKLVKYPYDESPIYKLNFTDPVAAVETAAILKAIIPKLLGDSYSLSHRVEITTEPTSEEYLPE